jgi:DNA-binding beta-propeller fold protein YncE
MKKVLFIMLLATSLFANELYVVNSISQTLSKIDLNSQTVNNSFALLGLTPGNAANKIAIWQHFAFVVITYENSIQKIDLTGNEPATYIFLEDSASPYHIVIYDHFAYVTGNETNKVYKIDLLSNSVVASLLVGQSPQGMTIYDNHLFVANTGFNYSNFTFEQGSVSKIYLPDFSLISTINTDKNPVVLQVVNGFLHTVCTGDYSTSFGKVNIIDPNSDEIGFVLETGDSPSSIAAFNHEKVYLGNSWPAGVFQYNALNYAIEVTPNDAIFLGGNSVYVFQDKLVTLDARDYQQNSLVRIYSTTDNTLLAQYSVGIGATDVIFLGEESHSDFTILPISNPLLTNYPNPFNPSTTIQFSSDFFQPNELLTLEIYNLKGQKIRQFNIKNSTFKINEVVWDGKDFQGKNVNSGVYLYRIKDGNHSVSNKMMLLK